MSKKNSKQKPKKNKKLIILAVFFSIIIFYFVLSHSFHFASYFNVNNINQQIESVGVFGPLFFILLMALAIVISPIPSLPLDAAAGIVWGPWLATLYASIGALMGAVIAFSIARYLGKDIMNK